MISILRFMKKLEGHTFQVSFKKEQGTKRDKVIVKSLSPVC